MEVAVHAPDEVQKEIRETVQAIADLFDSLKVSHIVGLSAMTIITEAITKSCDCHKGHMLVMRNKVDGSSH